MENTDFDYLVLGAGSGGIASGRWAAAKFGTKVGIIEMGPLGGTCVNVGCVPKKVMFNCASFMDDLEMIGSYGFKGLEKLTLDFPTLKLRRDNYVKRLNGIYANMLSNNQVTHIQGWGKFVDKNTIEVNGVNYTGKHILIATGSAAVKPQIEGAEFATDSNGFFDFEELPKKVIVVGGGYIGTELG